MSESNTWTRRILTWALPLLALAATGCELDSFMNPSVVGRWERTPVVMPILDQLDIIDEPTADPPGLSQITPADLEPDIKEYVIGGGDVVAISVFELVAPGQDFTTTRRVDALGNMRLPIVGTVKVSGQTEEQLEKSVGEVIEDKGLLKDPTISVVVQQRTQDTYSVMGEPRNSGTLIGTFSILHPDFRLLDAIALARGTSGRIRKLFVIREVKPRRGDEPAAAKDADASNGDELIDDPNALLEKALDGGAGEGDQAPPMSDTATRDRTEKTTYGGDGQGEWVYVDNRWVRMESTVTGPGVDGGDGMGAVLTQRVIEVPYDKLQDGDMQYNIVIRPGDIIRVPSPVIGNVFIMGAINRPGTFGLPGDKELTLQRLIAAAGGLNQLAWPERVDLTRSVGDSEQATVRLNIRAIFEGTQPDFYLKPNDLINVGQSFVSTPLAVARNGFRMTYGFGFILDRNFGVDVFRELNAKLR